MPTNQQRREAAKRKLERQLVTRQERAKSRRQRNLIGGVIVGVVAVAVVIWLVTAQRSSSTDTASTDTSTNATSASAPTTPCSYPKAAELPVKAVQPPTNTNPATTGTVDAVMTLGQGAVPITLDRALAPCAVNAFVSLATQKFYDSTNCHRLTTDADLKVLQCGDPSGTGRGGPGFNFPLEANPVATDPAPTDSSSAATTETANTAATSADTAGTDSASTAATSADTATTTAAPAFPIGTVAMATTGATNGSQFFIVYGDSNLAAGAYTRIGTVNADGLAVIDQIAAKGAIVGSNPNGATDAPAEPVTIASITVPADAAIAEAPSSVADTATDGLGLTAPLATDSVVPSATDGAATSDGAATTPGDSAATDTAGSTTAPATSATTG